MAFPTNPAIPDITAGKIKGVTLSTILVNAGIASFESLGSTNPRELELSFVGKNECVVVYISIVLKNHKDLEERRTTSDNHGCTLLVGNADDDLILFKKIRDSQLLEMGQWSRKVDVPRAQRENQLHIHWISDSYGIFQFELPYFES
ncbi:probable ATP-dependent DNA helicase HFM1 [Trichonephila clavata]|uniref:Probable ATP-dependent DNA helicase HFM1 n=1 Tax=Trichonephila clavata TaxID=2740835 RepID=A0A8X6GNB5_TRICU|nr:probable ATP-dependent DNA helicase HFM1 [Trichonephila clavata]